MFEINGTRGEMWSRYLPAKCTLREYYVYLIINFMLQNEAALTRNSLNNKVDFYTEVKALVSPRCDFLRSHLSSEMFQKHQLYKLHYF